MTGYMDPKLQAAGFPIGAFGNDGEGRFLRFYDRSAIAQPPLLNAKRENFPTNVGLSPVSTTAQLLLSDRSAVPNYM